MSKITDLQEQIKQQTNLANHTDTDLRELLTDANKFQAFIDRIIGRAINSRPDSKWSPDKIDVYTVEQVRSRAAREFEEIDHIRAGVMAHFTNDLGYVKGADGQIYEVDDNGNLSATPVQEWLEKNKELDERERQVIVEANKEVIAQLRRESNSILSRGKSRQWDRLGLKIKRFGAAMGAAANGEQPNVAIAGLGKSIEKFSGALGILSWGLKLMATAQEIENNNTKAATDKVNAETQRDVAIINAGGQMAQAQLSAAITVATSAAQTYGQLGLMGIQNGANGYVAAHETATKGISDIKGSMFAAANSAIDLAAGHLSYKNAEKYDLMALAAKEHEASVTKAAAAMSYNAETKYQNETYRIKEEQIKFQTQQANDKLMMHAADDVFFNFGSTLGITQYAEARMENSYAIQNQKWELDSQRAEMSRMQTQFQAEYMQQQASAQSNLAQQKAQLRKQMEDTLIQAAAQIAHAWMNFSQEMFNRFQKMETAANHMGAYMGLNKKELMEYAYSMSHIQRDVAKWGKDMTDMEKTQVKYQETTGRNTRLTSNDYETTYANALMMDGDSVDAINAEMNLFNTSVTDSNLYLNKMFKSVSTQGMNANKYVKDIVKNLKTVEKHDFSGGLKGFEKMAAWAQKTRFNIGAMDTILSNIKEGGLENLIQKAMGLQVLGGHFADFADPFRMLFETYNAPEDLAKRFNSMLKGMGAFSKQTGQFEFNNGAAGKIILEAAAKQMNMSYEDLYQQILQESKQEAMLRDTKLGSMSLNESEMAAAVNIAKYDPTTATWKIGSDDFNTLTKEQLQKLLPIDLAMTEAGVISNLKNYAQKMMGTQEQMNVTQKKMQARLMEDTWWEARNTAIRSINNITDEFHREFHKYTSETNKSLGEVQKSMEDLLNLFKEDTSNPILQLANSISNSISEIGAIVKKDFISGMRNAENALATGINFPPLPQSLSKLFGSLYHHVRYRVKIGGGRQDANDVVLNERNLYNWLINAIDSFAQNKRFIDGADANDVKKNYERFYNMARASGMNINGMSRDLNTEISWWQKIFGSGFTTNDALAAEVRTNLETYRANNHLGYSQGGFTYPFFEAQPSPIGGVVHKGEWLAGDTILGNPQGRMVIQRLHSYQNGVRVRPMKYTSEVLKKPKPQSWYINPKEHKLQPLDVNVEGVLRIPNLTPPSGEDIMDMLRRNPIASRELISLITKEITSDSSGRHYGTF